jgi:uncharacterized RDD family membrane protein YckC
MEQAETTETTIEYPSLTTRVQSNAVDGVLLLICMFAFANVVGDNNSIPGWGKALIFVGLWLLYEPICTAYGATPGNYLMGIRVRDINDYTKKLSPGNAFVRSFVKASLGGWSFVSVHFNPRRRAIHDLAAKSIMLDVSEIRKLTA